MWIDSWTVWRDLMRKGISTSDLIGIDKCTSVSQEISSRWCASLHAKSDETFTAETRPQCQTRLIFHQVKFPLHVAKRDVHYLEFLYPSTKKKKKKTTSLFKPLNPPTKHALLPRTREREALLVPFNPCIQAHRSKTKPIYFDQLWRSWGQNTTILPILFDYSTFLAFTMDPSSTS